MIAAVIAWELRRLRANRMSWALGAAVFVFCLGLTALKHSWGRPVVDGVTGESIEILGTTAVGLPYLMISGLLTLFALFLPFVATEAVARDYQVGLHELLMTTPVSSAAYVWGRYLACLSVSLVLDLALLLAVVVMGVVLHVGQQIYPVPDIGLALGIWIVGIVPATVVVSSVSFGVGTLFVRRAVFVKLAALLSWASMVFLVDVVDHGGTWFTYWNPTSYGIVRVNVDSFLQTYLGAVSGVAEASQRMAIGLQLQQRQPDLWPWVPPHLVLVIASLVLVGAVAGRFGRFRQCLG
jgi:ABC-type transport system involved in multi-copper enzyme maturation permease subunit